MQNAVRYDDKLDVMIQRDYQVVKSNEIIQRARYDLTITELKTFAFILSKIKPNDKENQEYVISIKDFCLVCGIDHTNGGNYQHVKKALKSLRDKSFWLADKDGKETLVGWLAKARIDKRSGKVTVRLDEDIQKHVLGLYNNYTQYSLLYTLPMKSSYSFRIYEHLKSHAFKKVYTFDLDDLKQKIGAAVYTNFKDFRKKVLEVAVEEINEYTDLEVSWEPITKGKKVIQLKFEIKQRDSWGQFVNISKDNKQLDGQMDLFDYLPEAAGDKQITITGPSKRNEET